jgi:hypothetical protein
LGIYNKN